MEQEHNNEKFSIEECQAYYVEFMKKFNGHEEMILELEKKATGMSFDDKQKELNAIQAQIKSERDEFYNVVSFLPKYDQTKYLNRYEELLEKTNQLKTKLFPKKKFAFAAKTKDSTKTQVKNSIVQKDENKVIEGTGMNGKSDLIIKDKTSEKIILSKEDVEGKNNVMIENVKSCDIVLLYNFKACYIKNAEDCKVIIGSVSGGSHLTHCEKCEIYLATHQLRIHETTHTNFFVLTNSNPIIEKSTSNMFYPLKIKYNSFEDNITIAKIDVSNNKWNQVQDFQWLKKEKSPNFDVLNTNTEITIKTD